MPSPSSPPSTPAYLTFPPSATPRTWLITAAASPVGVRLARTLLSHGDNVVLGALPSGVTSFSPDRSEDDGDKGKGHEGGEKTEEGSRADTFASFVRTEAQEKGWKERMKVVQLDGRIVGQCQAAVAAAIEAFGALDVLFCCASEAVIGAVEELGASQRTRALVREQFETNLFGPINIMKAALPPMRERKSGHIIALTGITSHLGTPGLGLFCAAGWAIEGFCDSLAYEVAPFNIKLTIVQPNYEVSVLSNQISAAPTLPQYSPSSHPAPLARSMMGRLIDRIEGIDATPTSPNIFIDETTRRDSTTTDPASSSSSHQDARETSHVSFSDGEAVTSIQPRLPQQMLDSLVAETVHAVAAIGGHVNPPARHIVGHEGVASVKEKLKTVSEELEDFVDCSGAVDIIDGDG